MSNEVLPYYETDLWRILIIIAIICAAIFITYKIVNPEPSTEELVYESFTCDELKQSIIQNGQFTPYTVLKQYNEDCNSQEDSPISIKITRGK